MKKKNCFNGKLSIKTISFDLFFNEISLRCLQIHQDADEDQAVDEDEKESEDEDEDENSETNELKNQIAQLQQFVFSHFPSFFIERFILEKIKMLIN